MIDATVRAENMLSAVFGFSAYSRGRAAHIFFQYGFAGSAADEDGQNSVGKCQTSRQRFC